MKLRTFISTMAITAVSLYVTPSIAEEKEYGWKGNAELGFISIDGNSESTNFKAGSEVIYENEQWRDTITFDAINSKSTDDVGVESRTAERYFLANKADYKFTEHDYIFFLTSYEKDRFGVFDEELVAVVGYGRRLLNTENMTWDLEFGPGFRRDKFADGSDNDETIWRLGTKYEWLISDTSTFTQIVSIESGSDNTITRSESSITASLVGSLSMKLAYILRYSEEIMRPATTDHADTETSVTLLYQF